MEDVDDRPRPTCLLKIHQKYCDKILSGEKTYEYRKRCPDWIEPGCEMVLCSSDEPAVPQSFKRLSDEEIAKVQELAKGG